MRKVIEQCQSVSLQETCYTGKEEQERPLQIQRPVGRIPWPSEYWWPRSCSVPLGRILCSDGEDPRLKLGILNPCGAQVSRHSPNSVTISGNRFCAHDLCVCV